MLRHTCEHCTTVLEVPDTFAGKRARCPRCRQVMRIAMPKPDLATARVCSGCQSPIAQHEEVLERDGGIYCSFCMEELAPKVEAEDEDSQILDEIGLNIPGMVVLKGQRDRFLGRVSQDRAARGDPVEAAPPPEAKQDAEEQLCQILLSRGVVDQTMLEKVKAFGQRGGGSIAWALDGMGVLGEHDLVQLLAEEIGLGYCLDGEIEVDLAAAAGLDLERLRKLEILPVSVQGDVLQVAVVNPLDLTPLQELADATGHEIEAFICTESCFRKSFATLEP